MGRDKDENKKEAPNSMDIRDLSDFCQKWPGLRHMMEMENPAIEAMPSTQKEMVRWLVILADRVCPTENF